jgi:hypothetical protein
MNNCLLTIYVPPTLEEALEDWLLENEAISGFSTMEGFGHGSRPSGMTLLEQVTGRQRRVQFLIETDLQVAAQMLSNLREKFAGVGLHYMLTPLLEAGSL